jgi:hypothetical protein
MRRSFATEYGLRLRASNAYTLAAFAPWNRCVLCGRKPDAIQKEAFTPLLLIFELSSIIFGSACQQKSPIKTGFSAKAGNADFQSQIG